MGNVHVCNNGISSIHGKELPEQLSLHCEHDRSHTQQMFDISTKLVSEQDEISGLETICWENHSWRYLSLIGDERIINLQRTKVYVYPQSNDAWEQRLGWIKSSQNYRNFDIIDGEPMEFEWHIFPGFKTLQLSDEVKSFLYRLGQTPEIFAG